MNQDWPSKQLGQWNEQGSMESTEESLPKNMQKY
jgi:hypothetical protein